MKKGRWNRPPPSLKLGELRLAWLVTFLTVVRLENRSAAGKELGLTQGAVTKQIHCLEDWSRTLLLVPEHPVKLTDDGEAFKTIAEQALKILGNFRRPLPHELYGPPKPKIPSGGLRVPPSIPRSSATESADER